jgi:hypothetical protein
MRAFLTRTSMTVALLFAVSSLVGCAPSGEASGDSRRPVLFITVGGLVPSDVDAFGGPNELPRLRGFVAQSTAWSDALSAAPMTRPAIATYLTGVAPDRHGVRDDVFASLPGDVPTLAELLGAEGYLTAAFPDSSFLSEQSGLWRGFDLVDNPPVGSRDPGRWLPQFHGPNSVDVPADWIRALDGDAEWFAWVHMSYPLLGQLRDVLNRGDEQAVDAEEGSAEDEGEVATLDPGKSYEATLQEFDLQLGKLLDAVDARNDGTLVVLAGTLGDVQGDPERQIPMGMGFSLDDTAVNVPVAIRFPQGAAPANTSEAIVWSPDVAATIAAWSGVELDPRAEGRDLALAGQAGRTIFSWSWAPLDQFGWHPLVLASDDQARIVIDGDREVGEAGQEAIDRLREAIAGRDTPSPRRLPEDVVAELLAAHDVEPKPIADAGRDFPDAEERRVVAGRVVLGRSYYLRQDFRRGHNLIGGIGRRLDPENVTAWVDRGHALAFMRNPDSARLLRRALVLRPSDSDIWHWYAHALLRTDLEAADKILVAIQPHLTDQADVLYDLACTRSLLADEDGSADYLTRAWEAGFRDRSKIEADADLRHLRETGKLSEVMRKVQ